MAAQTEAVAVRKYPPHARGVHAFADPEVQADGCPFRVRWHRDMVKHAAKAQVNVSASEFFARHRVAAQLEWRVMHFFRLVRTRDGTDGWNGVAGEAMHPS